MFTFAYIYLLSFDGGFKDMLSEDCAGYGCFKAGMLAVCAEFWDWLMLVKGNADGPVDRKELVGAVVTDALVELPKMPNFYFLLFSFLLSPVWFGLLI